MCVLIFSLISLFPLINNHLPVENWQVIETKSYSIELPSSWIKMYENERVATIKGASVRTTYNSWNDKALTESNGTTISSLIIESYNIQEKEILSVDEMHTLLLSSKILNGSVIETLEKSVSEGQAYYVLLCKDRSMSVSGGTEDYERIRHVMLLCRNGINHILFLSTPKDSALDKKVVNRILDSYKLKE